MNKINSLAVEEENLTNEDDLEKNNRDKSSDAETDEQIDVNMKLNYQVQENRKEINRVIDRVFKPRPKINNLKVISKHSKEMKKSKEENENKEKYKVNVELQQMIKENERIVKLMNSRDKVTLVIPIIRKFYSFNFLDYVRNTYCKINSNSKSQEEKSYAELYDFQTVENDPYKNCVVKVIEGTDEIQVHNRHTKKIEKIKVEFDVKKLNTKVFYKGCKSHHIQGKVYISGGKDFNGDKTLFMVYNLQEKKLTRLHDMKYPRSFHTFVFNETMRALLAIGGENNNSCEFYDFYLNMWNDFPELTYPRANIELVFNSSGTYAYSMFGIQGDIVNKQMSDVIEVIDMIDLNKGWYKLEYTNNTGIDIKADCITIEKLPNDKLLLYGGLEQRNPLRMHLLFDLKTFEMTKVNLKQVDTLKNLAVEKKN
jgi:hypothetical protein